MKYIVSTLFLLVIAGSIQVANLQALSCVINLKRPLLFPDTDAADFEQTVVISQDSNNDAIYLVGCDQAGISVNLSVLPVTDELHAGNPAETVRFSTPVLSGRMVTSQGNGTGTLYLQKADKTYFVRIGGTITIPPNTTPGVYNTPVNLIVLDVTYP